MAERDLNARNTQKSTDTSPRNRTSTTSNPLQLHRIHHTHQVVYNPNQIAPLNIQPSPQQSSSNALHVPSVSLIERSQPILPFNVLCQYFNCSSKDAAAKLNTSISYLKKQCRAHNIQRWPYRKIAALNSKIEERRTSLQSIYLHPSQRSYLEKELSDLKTELEQIYTESFYHSQIQFIDMSTQLSTASTEDDSFSDDSTTTTPTDTSRSFTSPRQSEYKMDIQYILNPENRDTKEQDFDTTTLFK